MPRLFGLDRIRGLDGDRQVGLQSDKRLLAQFEYLLQSGGVQSGDPYRQLYRLLPRRKLDRSICFEEGGDAPAPRQGDRGYHLQFDQIRRHHRVVVLYLKDLRR